MSNAGLIWCALIGAWNGTCGGLMSRKTGSSWPVWLALALTINLTWFAWSLGWLD